MLSETEGNVLFRHIGTKHQIKWLTPIRSYAHVIGNGRGFAKAYTMECKNESIYALDDLLKKVGIPEVLLCDNDATMEGWSEWKKRICKYIINPKYTEPYSPFQNKTKLGIRELKRMICRFQDKTQSPRRLWNYHVNLCSRIRSFVAETHPDLQGRCAFEQVHGWTPDISRISHAWVVQGSRIPRQ